MEEWSSRRTKKGQKPQNQFRSIKRTPYGGRNEGGRFCAPGEKKKIRGSHEEKPQFANQSTRGEEGKGKNCKEAKKRDHEHIDVGTRIKF